MSYILRKATEEMDESMPMPCESEMDSEGNCCQTLEFDTTQIPEIASWQVGGEYLIILKVTQTKSELEKEPDGNISQCATFQINEVGAFSDPVEDLRSQAKNKLK